MSTLYQCVEHGWQNVWNNSINVSERSLIDDTVSVKRTDLSNYDKLFSQKRSVVCQ